MYCRQTELPVLQCTSEKNMTHLIHWLVPKPRSEPTDYITEAKIETTANSFKPHDPLPHKFHSLEETITPDE